jgi:hypothetical protein
MIIIPNQRELKTYEKTFKERKQVGDRAENCFAEYLKTKYSEGSITHRQKEENVEFKHPDFVVITEKNSYEFEVKTTNKVKVRDYNYQLQYAVDKKLLLYFIFIKIINSQRFTFRPIEIRHLLDYRVLFMDGVYNDSILKPYFTLDLDLYYGKDYERKWVEFHSPFPIF